MKAISHGETAASKRKYSRAAATTGQYLTGSHISSGTANIYGGGIAAGRQAAKSMAAAKSLKERKLSQPVAIRSINPGGVVSEGDGFGDAMRRDYLPVASRSHQNVGIERRVCGDIAGGAALRYNMPWRGGARRHASWRTLADAITRWAQACGAARAAYSRRSATSKRTHRPAGRRGSSPRRTGAAPEYQRSRACRHAVRQLRRRSSFSIRSPPTMRRATRQTGAAAVAA